jgi:hypothetical protein
MASWSRVVRWSHHGTSEPWCNGVLLGRGAWRHWRAAKVIFMSTASSRRVKQRQLAAVLHSGYFEPAHTRRQQSDSPYLSVETRHIMC